MKYLYLLKFSAMLMMWHKVNFLADLNKVFFLQQPSQGFELDDPRSFPKMITIIQRISQNKAKKKNYSVEWK